MKLLVGLAVFLVCAKTASLEDIGSEGTPCLYPPYKGPCDERIKSWYYDWQDEVCKTFIYGGCLGNANRFDTEEECMAACYTSVGICGLPPDPGPCGGYIIRWYYNAKKGYCEQFVYGGCAGNQNNFESRTVCELACGDYMVS